MFGEDFLSELRNRCDIVDIVSRYVQLKKSSASFVGLCPFHNEKTPSFHVNPSGQFFHCFGCQTGGDVITFIMKMENLSYREAVEHLASIAGLSVPKSVSFDGEIGRLRKDIYEMNRIAARYFHDILMSDKGKPALDYLLNRGLSMKTIVNFGLGASPPEGWYNLINHLRSKGYNNNQIRQSGLASTSDKGMFDRFRNRVMFPIIDHRNNVIGFGGRTMENDPAKYLNTSENVAFKKGSNLYALNFAKSTKTGSLILCEGYMDVISLHQAGFNSAVATLGTALTLDQARLMKRMTDNVIICYDSDEAGRNATKRAIDILKSVDLNVRVITVTGGKDPDEFIKTHGAQKFAALLTGSVNHIDYRLDEVKRKYNTDIDNEKVSCINEMLGVLSDITNKVEIEIYIDKISKMLNVSTENLLAELNSVKKKINRIRENKQKKEELENLKGMNDKINPQRSKYLKASRAEEDIISILINYPEKYKKVLENVNETDFVTDFNRSVFVVLCEKLEQNTNSNVLHTLSALFDSDKIGKIMSYISSLEAIEVNDDKIKQIATTLKEEKIKATMNGLSINDNDFSSRLDDLRKNRKRDK
ncbi:MAG: DNA primase [Ruminococcaceae bacterium]|nr:DNA primase [Oscillospiraceae bacterium]